MPKILLQDVDKYSQGLSSTDKWSAYILLNQVNIEMAHLNLDIKILNKLSSLPNCESLDCHSRSLKRLPFLPNCITLRCYDNLLTEIPPLPKCKTLLCSQNQITELPALPLCEYLDCEENLLTQLPELPKCEVLYCSNNFLLNLPLLPNIRSLSCSYNNFPIAPVFPKEIMFKYEDSYTSKLHILLDIFDRHNSWTKIKKLCPMAQLSWLSLFGDEVTQYIKNIMKGFKDLPREISNRIYYNFKVDTADLYARDEENIYKLLRKIANSKNTHTVSGVPILQIPPAKIYLTASGYVHNIDDLARYIIPNPLKNQDPLGKKGEKIWSNELEKKYFFEASAQLKQILRQQLSKPQVAKVIDLLGKLSYVLGSWYSHDKDIGRHLVQKFLNYIKRLPANEKKTIYNLSSWGYTVRDIEKYGLYLLDYKLYRIYEDNYLKIQPNFPNMKFIPEFKFPRDELARLNYIKELQQL